MQCLEQSFSVSFHYPIYFTEGIFQPENRLLGELLTASVNGAGALRKAMFVVDDGVVKSFPHLLADIEVYFAPLRNKIDVPAAPFVIPGGEQAKNDAALFQQLLKATSTHGIDRHSYIVAIGGGAVLDLVGFAAAVAHRGIRHIRIPTTVLAQNDSGVGVKNSINAFDKKNYLGTFTPPAAVINDRLFLTSLHDRDWRAGIAEAVKVALIKDAAFFRFLEENAGKLLAREMAAMDRVIYRCAEMHTNHIKSGDPFELGSSRPLDFGHWAAHKLEQLTSYAIRHGEAVALGIALDATYAHLAGMLSADAWKRILRLLTALKFDLFIPEMTSHLEDPAHPHHFLKGLSEFREHLGGDLTVMLLEDIGKGREVHAMDTPTIVAAIRVLEKYKA